jgi:hypothetical protein
VVVASTPEFTIRLEAAESTYVVTDIDPESVFLRTAQDSVPAGISSKAPRVVDSNRNGLPELELVVPGAGLRRLVSGVRGKTQMTLKVTGRLVTGAHLVGSLPLEIVGVPQAPFRSGVWPNPMNPSGIIALHNERVGRVHVELYDVSGRLVRTVWDGVLPEGMAELPVDGKNDRGTALSSGVYYYRVATVDGVRKGRLTVLK